MIVKKRESSVKNMEKLNELGLNRHFGDKNPRWNGGNRLNGNYPCSKCGRDRFIEKRNAYRLCKSCSMHGKKRGKYINTENFKRGSEHYRWRGGVTKENMKIRSSYEYRNWRRLVFERDDYTCQWCGARNGNGKKVVLNADHIKPFALYPELRFEVSNGRTLCEPCHAKTDTFRGKTKVNTFENLASKTYN